MWRCEVGRRVPFLRLLGRPTRLVVDDVKLIEQHMQQLGAALLARSAAPLLRLLERQLLLLLRRARRRLSDAPLLGSKQLLKLAVAAQLCHQLPLVDGAALFTSILSKSPAAFATHASCSSVADDGFFVSWLLGLSAPGFGASATGAGAGAAGTSARSTTSVGLAVAAGVGAAGTSVRSTTSVGLAAAAGVGAAIAGSASAVSSAMAQMASSFLEAFFFDPVVPFLPRCDGDLARAERALGDSLRALGARLVKRIVFGAIVSCC